MDALKHGSQASNIFEQQPMMKVKRRHKVMAGRPVGTCGRGWGSQHHHTPGCVPHFLWEEGSGDGLQEQEEDVDLHDVSVDLQAPMVYGLPPVRAQYAAGSAAGSEGTVSAAGVWEDGTLLTAPAPVRWCPGAPGMGTCGEKEEVHCQAKGLPFLSMACWSSQHLAPPTNAQQGAAPPLGSLLPSAPQPPVAQAGPVRRVQLRAGPLRGKHVASGAVQVSQRRGHQAREHRARVCKAARSGPAWGGRRWRESQRPAFRRLPPCPTPGWEALVRNEAAVGLGPCVLSALRARGSAPGAPSACEVIHSSA